MNIKEKKAQLLQNGLDASKLSGQHQCNLIYDLKRKGFGKKFIAEYLNLDYKWVKSVLNF